MSGNDLVKPTRTPDANAIALLGPGVTVIRKAKTRNGARTTGSVIRAMLRAFSQNFGANIINGAEKIATKAHI
jgi:hypothetical protein